MVCGFNRKYSTNRVLNPWHVVCESITLSARPRLVVSECQAYGMIHGTLTGHIIDTVSDLVFLLSIVDTEYQAWHHNYLFLTSVKFDLVVILSTATPECHTASTRQHILPCHIIQIQYPTCYFVFDYQFWNPSLIPQLPV